MSPDGLLPFRTYGSFDSIVPFASKTIPPRMTMLLRSLPLDRSGRLRRDVINHAVHPFYLIHDPAGNGFQHFVWQRDPIGGHAIFGVDGAHRASVGIGALIAHHADRHHRKQDRERLPDLGVETSLLDFGADDVITFAQDLQALGRDFAEDADGQTRSRERLPLQNLFRHAQIAANLSDFVLE